MHNIAVLLDPEGKYHLCPFFDHGASLLSDTSLDYPADGSRDLYKMIDSVKSKTVSADFDEQLETVEALYGDTLQFCFTKKQVSALLEEEPHYDAKTKRRVEDILFDRMRKYKYLFRSV